ncbi:MAG: tRNA lysidine(34) synthetase TilS [Croceibacterium sp.]
MTAPKARSAAPSELPAPGQIERFAKALERLWPEGDEPLRRLGLAVSGGADSLAMLLLADAVIPGRIEVATIDHGLRPAAADECVLVARACASRGITCETLAVRVPAGNVQAAARGARYRALGAWAEYRGLSAIATAHHADDQAETLLMRLNRASGHAGLGGVRERGVVPGSALPLIRPLLGFQRTELAAVVAAAGLIPAADPSNFDQRYDRVRMRGALASAEWLDPSALAASASHLADGDHALDWAADREWRETVVSKTGVLHYRRTAPRAIALRVIGRALETIGRAPRGQDVARLLARLEAGEGGNVAGTLATVEGDTWVFRPEPPRGES